MNPASATDCLRKTTVLHGPVTRVWPASGQRRFAFRWHPVAGGDEAGAAAPTTPIEFEPIPKPWDAARARLRTFVEREPQ